MKKIIVLLLATAQFLYARDNVPAVSAQFQQVLATYQQNATPDNAQRVLDVYQNAQDDKSRRIFDSILSAKKATLVQIQNMSRIAAATPSAPATLATRTVPVTTPAPSAPAATPTRSVDTAHALALQQDFIQRAERIISLLTPEYIQKQTSIKILQRYLDTLAEIGIELVSPELEDTMHDLGQTIDEYNKKLQRNKLEKNLVLLSNRIAQLKQAPDIAEEKRIFEATKNAIINADKVLYLTKPTIKEIDDASNALKAARGQLSPLKAQDKKTKDHYIMRIADLLESLEKKRIGQESKTTAAATFVEPEPLFPSTDEGAELRYGRDVEQARGQAIHEYAQTAIEEHNSGVNAITGFGI